MAPVEAQAKELLKLCHKNHTELQLHLTQVINVSILCPTAGELSDISGEPR